MLDFLKTPFSYFFQGSTPGTPTPSEGGSVGHSDSPLQGEDLSNRGLPGPQSPAGRSLDRVLLERNLERLLSERGHGYSAAELGTHIERVKMSQITVVFLPYRFRKTSLGKGPKQRASSSS